ncbi:MAG: hypothetical protein IJJ42_07930 [Clostridia bacterium]|nr:hypothetical protein [Clostridia bacterium]
MEKTLLKIQSHNALTLPKIIVPFLHAFCKPFFISPAGFSEPLFFPEIQFGRLQVSCRRGPAVLRFSIDFQGVA